MLKALLQWCQVAFAVSDAVDCAKTHLDTQVVSLVNQQLNLLSSLKHPFNVVNHDIFDLIHL